MAALAASAEQIGVALRAWREAKGLTREKVAPLVSTTTRTLVRWEDGDAPPPADQFLALVTLYGAQKELLILLAKFEKATRSAAGDSAAGEGKRRAG